MATLVRPPTRPLTAPAWPPFSAVVGMQCSAISSLDTATSSCEHETSPEVRNTGL